MLDEAAQALAQDIAREADTTLEVLEPACAVEGLAENDPNPSFAEDGGRSCDRAILVQQLGVLHFSDPGTSGGAKPAFLSTSLIGR